MTSGSIRTGGGAKGASYACKWRRIFSVGKKARVIKKCARS